MATEKTITKPQVVKCTMQLIPGRKFLPGWAVVSAPCFDPIVLLLPDVEGGFDVFQPDHVYDWKIT